MQTVVIPAFASGAPATGLSPSWYCLYNARTELAHTPQPTISEIGTTGVYKFAAPENTDLCGIIDLGATASPRYLIYEADHHITFAAFDTTPAPKAGLTLSWNVLKDVEGNNYTPQPTLIELGLGMYKVAKHTGRAVGYIDMSASAEPRYYAYDSDEAQSYIDSVTPDEPIALTPLDSRVVTTDLPYDLELGINDELVVVDGDLVLVTGLQAIRQGCYLALMSFKGEFFNDLDAGVPWFEDILGQKRDEPKIRTAIRDALLSVSGVTRISKLQIDWDGPSRTLYINWEVVAFESTTVSGETTL